MLGYLLIDGSEQNTELVHNLLVQFTGVSATSSETFREELKAMAALCIHRGREKSNTAIRNFFFLYNFMRHNNSKNSGKNILLSHSLSSYELH